MFSTEEEIIEVITENITHMLKCLRVKKSNEVLYMAQQWEFEMGKGRHLSKIAEIKEVGVGSKLHEKLNVLNVQPALTMWDVLKAKYEKPPASIDTYRADAFHKRHHDDHSDDHPEGEKGLKKQKTTKASSSANVTSSSKPTTVQRTKTSSSQPQQQEYDGCSTVQEIDDDEDLSEEASPEFLAKISGNDVNWVPTTADYHILKVAFDDMMRSRCQTGAKYEYQIQQATSYINNQIEKCAAQYQLCAAQYQLCAALGDLMILQLLAVKCTAQVIRVKNVLTHEQDLMEEILVKRVDEQAYIYSESDRKYLNKNDIKDMYLLCLKYKVEQLGNELMKSLVVYIKSCVIWERVHDYQLGIECYETKVNLTAPTLTLSGIEALLLITDPFIDIVYENSKKEKRVNEY
ncbi:hypothetical protein Tco_0923723 [Tanacetum coccineum]|uniref:Uncharacterized protein n=1 Tax=Tanacetum coccineum TaxID=301880 RepID=A0ABQ5D2Q3_9ASTR